MTATTRLTIRQTAAGRLGGLTTGTTTSTGTAPISTLTDTVNLLDSGDSNYDFVGAWAMFTSGLNASVEKRVSSFVGSAGVASVGNPFASNIAIGDAYELQDHLAPSQWNLCIDAALRRCTRRREVSVAVVTNQNQYSLAALTDLTKKKQVIEIVLQSGPAAQKTRRVASTLSEVEIWENDDVITLNFLSALTVDTTNNLEILVCYLAPYAALASDAATTTCDLDWVVSGTLLHAMERYRHRVEEPAKMNLGHDANDFQKDFLRLSMVNAPQIAKTIGARFV